MCVYKSIMFSLPQIKIGGICHRELWALTYDVKKKTLHEELGLRFQLSFQKMRLQIIPFNYVFKIQVSTDAEDFLAI